MLYRCHNALSEIHAMQMLFQPFLVMPFFNKKKVMYTLRLVLCPFSLPFRHLSIFISVPSMAQASTSP